MSVMEQSDEMPQVGGDALVDPSHIIRAETSDMIKPHFVATFIVYLLLTISLALIDNSPDHLEIFFYLFILFIFSIHFYYYGNFYFGVLRFDAKNKTLCAGHDTSRKISLRDIESIVICRYLFAPWKSVIVRRKNYQGTGYYSGLENPDILIDEIRALSETSIPIKRKVFPLPYYHPVSCVSIFAPGILLNLLRSIYF